MGIASIFGIGPKLIGDFYTRIHVLMIIIKQQTRSLKICQSNFEVLTNPIIHPTTWKGNGRLPFYPKKRWLLRPFNYWVDISFLSKYWLTIGFIVYIRFLYMKVGVGLMERKNYTHVP